MLVPCSERPSWIGTELAKVLHLKHRAEQDGAVLGVRVDEALRVLGVQHICRVALIHPVRGRLIQRSAGSVAGGRRDMPVAVRRDGRHGVVVKALRGRKLLRRGGVVRLL